MSAQLRRPLRTPAERVGMLPNADMPPPRDREETLLAHALFDRDERALGRAIDRLSAPMLSCARTYVRTEDEAQETVQETWIAALHAIRAFRGRSSLRTWLFKILRNRARTRAKRASRLVPFSQLASPDSESEPGSWLPGLDNLVGRVAAPDPEQELLARELGRRIERTVEHLPPRQRQVVLLRDFEGRTSEETCAALGLSPENQRVLLHRGRTAVRMALGPYLAAGLLEEGELSNVA